MPTARDPLALRLLVSILVSGHSGLVLPFVGRASAVLWTSERNRKTYRGGLHADAWVALSKSDRGMRNGNGFDHNNPEC